MTNTTESKAPTKVVIKKPSPFGGDPYNKRDGGGKKGGAKNQQGGGSSAKQRPMSGNINKFTGGAGGDR